MYALTMNPPIFVAQSSISSDFLGLDAPTLNPTKNTGMNVMGGNTAMKTMIPQVNTGVGMGVSTGGGNGSSKNPMNSNFSAMNGVSGLATSMSSGVGVGTGRPMNAMGMTTSATNSGMMNPLQASKSSNAGGSYDPFNSIDIMSGQNKSKR